MITYSASGQGKHAESTQGESGVLLALAHKFGIRSAYGVALKDNVASFYNRHMQLVGTIIVKLETRY